MTNSNNAQSAVTRIALCTDTHTWTAPAPITGSDGSLLMIDESEALTTILLDEVRRAKPDLLIHLGDITCGGGYFRMPVELFPEHLSRMSAKFRTLAPEVYAIPGNHDCPPGGGNWSAFEQTWGLRRGIGRTIDLPQVRLILVNTQGHDDAQIEESRPNDAVYGWVNDEELRRLSDELHDAGDKPVILFTHQLLHKWAAPRQWLSFFGVQNAERVLPIIADHPNVRAVFQGHAHFFEYQEVRLGGQPRPFIVTPSILEYPVAWLELEVDDRGLLASLRQLPVTDPIERALNSGPGQQWRGGDPGHRQFFIPW
jgi:3',5'-cyclic AMP phosphodiesterase CpdA